MKYPKTFVLLTLFCTAYGGFVDVAEWENTTEDCGRTRFENESLKIVNYHKAELGQFPWVARIGMKNPTEGEPPIFFCGGSLISKHYVLSDINCGHLGQIVRLGDYDIKNETDCDECGVCAPPAQDINVKRHLFGEQCTVKEHNDIVVMQLEKSAELNEFVRPICVPKEPVVQLRTDHNNYLAPGFGEVYPKLIRNPEKAGTLREMSYVNSIVLDHTQCNEVYQEPLSDNHICVGYPNSVNHPCVGDSGGSLVKFVKEGKVTRAYLVGIARYNTLMCEMDDRPPVVYTNVFRFSKWLIKQIMQSLLGPPKDTNGVKVKVTTPVDVDEEMVGESTTPFGVDNTTSGGNTTPVGGENTTPVGVDETTSGGSTTPLVVDDQESTSVKNEETTVVVNTETSSHNPTE